MRRKKKEILIFVALIALKSMVFVSVTNLFLLKDYKSLENSDKTLLKPSFPYNAVPL